MQEQLPETNEEIHKKHLPVRIWLPILLGSIILSAAIIFGYITQDFSKPAPPERLDSVVGVVIENQRLCGTDGLCLLTVIPENGETLEIEYGWGNTAFPVCNGDYEEGFNFHPGDTVQIYGITKSGNRWQVCSPDSYIKLVEENENWLTYSNEELGVELKYPNDWDLLEDAFSTYPSVFLSEVNDDLGDGGITISKKAGVSSEFTDQLNEQLILLGESNRSFNNQQWMEYIYKETDVPVEFYILVTDKGGYSYSISSKNYSETKKVIDQILSSLRFTH